MQLHQLKPIHKNRKSKRVGRGGKRGTYSSRGMKGQKSRAGRKFQPIVRELIKRYPKLRGYRFKPQEGKFAIVNTADLEKKFQTGEKVSPKTLLEKGLIEKFKNKMPAIKILGKGGITKALSIQDCILSQGAKTIIEKAGGRIK